MADIRITTDGLSETGSVLSVECQGETPKQVIIITPDGHKISLEWRVIELIHELRNSVTFVDSSKGVPMPKLKSKEEIDYALKRLRDKIKGIEDWWEQKGVGSSLWTGQCETSRREYAGLIAERDFYVRLRNKVVNPLGSIPPSKRAAVIRRQAEAAYRDKE